MTTTVVHFVVTLILFSAAIYTTAVTEKLVLNWRSSLGRTIWVGALGSMCVGLGGFVGLCGHLPKCVPKGSDHDLEELDVQLEEIPGY